MLTPEETTQFLQISQKLSNEMAAHVQFIKETFLPQVDTFNGHVAGRLHVPHASREAITTFMQGSARLATYTPMTVGSNNCYPLSLPVHQTIETDAILTCMFSDDMLQNVFGPDCDFALYFDAAYKSFIIHPFAGDYYNMFKPVRIYTNYDFYVEIAIIKGQYSETTTHYGYPNTHFTANPIPLSGCKLRRDQVSLKFMSLNANTPSVQELLNPGEKDLKKFLSKRKPFIHPVIILDYIRAQPLSDIMAFFGDVSAYELVAARTARKSEAAAHARTAMELAALKSARSLDAAAMREMQAALHAAAQQGKEHRTRQNDDALRIKRLQLKLAQTEKLYEDLQLRLIEQEDTMDDAASLNTDATARP
jgi:hypothetical protein